MSYKIDRKKSNKFGKILISAGLSISLLSGAYLGIHLFEQQAGIDRNEDIIQTVIYDENAEVKPSENANGEVNYNETSDEVTYEEYTPKYNVNDLKEEYPNIWGILEKPDGSVLPIVSTSSIDEENYYLSHSLDGTYSSAGTLFVDHANQSGDQITRIWGHNLSGNGKVFGDLTEYQNQGQEFYDANDTYILYTTEGVYELKVFAALEENATERKFNYKQEDDFLSDMQENIQDSNFVSNININGEDTVIVFSTCPDRGSINSGENRFSVFTQVNPIYTYSLNSSKTL